jgi:hypothetical protein
MRGPPDPKCERAALAGSPNRKIHLPCIENPTELLREFQAASLRRRFALGYCVAAALAPLVWGLPR